MINAAVDLHIAKLVEEVFDRFADGRNDTHWNPGTKGAVEKITSGPVGVGRQYRGDYSGFGTFTLGHR